VTSNNAAEDARPVIITHLQMFARPAELNVVAPFPNLSIVQSDPPTVAFYRFLYDGVGGIWNWRERRVMPDGQLSAIVQHPRVETYVLYVSGTPAGYAELDRRQENEIELAYFGLMPEFIGRGLGTYLLNWAIDRAWSYAPDRFWVHTCTLDHPKALPNYIRSGFTPFKTEGKPPKA
jgi:GNAT superfamily N-acetyltransferase